MVGEGDLPLLCAMIWCMALVSNQFYFRFKCVFKKVVGKNFFIEFICKCRMYVNNVVFLQTTFLLSQIVELWHLSMCGVR